MQLELQFMTKHITPKNIILYAEDDEDDRFLIEEAFAIYADRVDMICVKMVQKPFLI